MNFEITKGKIPHAKRVVLYGVEGIGKSTFASKFPDPLFIDTEGSTKNLDVARLPDPENWVDLIAEVDHVAHTQNLCQTLVIDTIDWAEQMATEYICSENNKSGIEAFGYGKGYTVLADEIKRLLHVCDAVIDAGINVVITAHSALRKFEQPDEMGSYDRYELKLTKKSAPIVKEWADLLIFISYKTFTVKDENGKSKVKGGKRTMYTTHNPCWDAKNRYGLPDEMNFDYDLIAPIFGNAEPRERPKQDVFRNLVEEEEKPKEEKSRKSNKPASEPNPKSRKFGRKSLTEQLKEKMEECQVTDEEIRRVMHDRGMIPDRQVSVFNYEQEYQGAVEWMFTVWDKIVEQIKENREELPF